MQKDKKKDHNKIVKYIREKNKYIGSDVYLGLNRFRIDMWSENFHRYSDGSGFYIHIIFKMTDAFSGNTAFFYASNYDYEMNINLYLNDFMIRCSSCRIGHYPPLKYIAYDVHKTIKYNGDEVAHDYGNDVINKYDFTGKCL